MFGKLALLALVVIGFVLFVQPQPAHAYDPFRSVKPGVEGVCTNTRGVKTSTSTACAAPTSSNPLLGPQGLLIRAIRILAIVAGIAAVIVIIIGGIQYVTGGGDSKNVSNAKNTILYALIGLVVIVAAQSIISFVLSKL